LATAGEASSQGNYMSEDRRKRIPRGNERTGRQDGLPREERCEGVEQGLRARQSSSPETGRSRGKRNGSPGRCVPTRESSARTRSCRIVPKAPCWVTRPGKSPPAARGASAAGSCAESKSNRVGQRSAAPAMALTRIFCACKGTHTHLLDVPVAGTVTTTKRLIIKSTKAVLMLRLKKRRRGYERAGESHSVTNQ
jgi:hypothetical protein